MSRPSVSGAGGERLGRAGYGAGLVAVMLASLLLGVCGSATSAPPKSTTAPKSTAAQAKVTASTACEQVSDALADGPDPDADPVGHAEAQVIPLDEIKTSDVPLEQAIVRLADAFQTFVHEDGTKSAASVVDSASKQIDKFCPGATS